MQEHGGSVLVAVLWLCWAAHGRAHAARASDSMGHALVAPQEPSVARCPHDCFEHLGHGHCDAGTCVCNAPFTGEACLDEQTNCPAECSNHGTCHNGRCACDAGWSGDDCSTLQSCPNECSGRGTCVQGACACDPGFVGEDCSQVQTSCPKDCSGRGTCVEGRCHCDRGYTGADCGLVVLCKEVHRRELGACESLSHDPREQYFVSAHSSVADSLKRVESAMAIVNNTCTGGALSRERALAVLCAKLLPFCNPRTQKETMVCAKECADTARECGFKVPEFCPADRFVDAEEEPVPPYMFYHDAPKWQPKCKAVLLPGGLECPNHCSNHGRCNTNEGKCLCFESWQAEDCSVPKCPNDCSGHGACLGEPTPGKCKCDKGWTSRDCSVKLCPNDCTSPDHGRCDNGTCVCHKPWSSADCSVPKCPKDCSGHGDCQSSPAGVCDCHEGWHGEDCSLRRCPNDCSGHGNCDSATGKCTCHQPWTKDDCSVATCPNDCSDHGVCQQRKNPGSCLCDDPWFSDDCSLMRCPRDCSGHGECDHKSGVCTCEPMYYAEDCSRSHCPNDCFQTHGKCTDVGKCECFDPWTGVDCGVAVCPKDCSKHGECLQTTQDAGKCECRFPWTQADCSVARCPNDCTNHGTCLQDEQRAGTCACEKPWIGSDCSVAECPNDCSGHGQCAEGKCVCFSPYTAEDCSVPSCPKQCSGEAHGTCDRETGVCTCKEPFTGVDCSTALCPNECSHHGFCDRNTGECKCDSPFYSVDCSQQPCPEDCSQHGTCNTASGLCECDEGWFGPACAETTPSPTASPSESPSESPSLTASPSASTSPQPSPVPSASTTASPSPSLTPFLRCPGGCSGHGDCRSDTGVCSCNAGWIHDDCARPVCGDDCHQRGKCVQPDLCVCDDGFFGDLCEHRRCPLDCSGHGECDRETGVCDCEDLWGDKGCSTRLCVPPCARGECVDGQCECPDGYGGEDCSEKLCPQPCKNGGVCKDGVCVCPAGFAGADCSEVPVGGELPTPGCDCGNRGKCVEGVCQCNPGFSGPRCENMDCKFPCENGKCDPKTGKCVCDTPFYGEDCLGKPCPGYPVCSDHGECQYHGTCKCNHGYGGEACASFECPNQCSNHGLCEAPGQCTCTEGWDGEDCATPHCEGSPECSGPDHGVCEGPMKCRCEVGWQGDVCDDPVPCPNDCSNHGECVNEVCQCEPDWLGADCSVELTMSCKDAPEGCNGRGVCRCGGDCECSPGFVGRLCQRPARCPDGCSGRGQCVEDGVCRCYDGIGGETCNLQGESTLVVSLCPNDCSGQGVCNMDGACSCFVGFGSDDCSLSQPVECPQACNGHGLCEMFDDVSLPECVCSKGWSGHSCLGKERICPFNCSCNGACIDNVCVCNEGFEGDDCSLRSCPNDCSGHGTCDDGVCKCDAPWYLFDCSSAMCPYNCSKHGACNPLTGTCICEEGFQGDDCAFRNCPGSPMCNGPERCDGQTGQCVCPEGWTGEACECHTCPKNCSARGECNCDGVCRCESPYFGAGCDLQACPADCSGNGKCNQLSGVCACAEGFREKDCSVRMCPGEAEGHACSHHGVCDSEDGVCDCDPGWAGGACEHPARTACPKDCSPPHGVCDEDTGRCECKVGWTGVSCSLKDLPCPGPLGSPCTGNGNCLKGKCYCFHGWQGEACADAVAPECAMNCSHHGVCINGNCKCEWDFVGAACQKFRCPNGCSGHGVCNTSSACACDVGWDILSPEDCSKGPHLLCPECVHGTCDFSTGKCQCPEGYEGDDCSIAICPKRCHKVGACIDGVCDCEPGYVGLDCGTVDMGLHFCSGKGRYDRETGMCRCEGPYEGEDCSEIGDPDVVFDRLCMTNCTGRGICNHVTGACDCDEGWGALDCSEKLETKCDSLCRGHGVCTEENSCFCAPMYNDSACDAYLTGFREDKVETLGPAKMCPESCSEHGVCNDVGACECYGGPSVRQAYWGGPDCAEGHCPGDCSGHGECVPENLTCLCRDDWTGWACEIEPPPCSGCSGHGECDCLERVDFKGKEQCGCECDKGFEGVDCEKVVPCPAAGGVACNGRGLCIAGECQCNVGFAAPDCVATNFTAPVPCPTSHNAACAGHGDCLLDGQCQCFPGWQGFDCNRRTTDCPLSCSGHGACEDDLGTCACFDEFESDQCGAFATMPVYTEPCPANCTGHGMCCNGRCKCLDGWKGVACSIEAPSCPNRCSGNGVCGDDNVCECAQGFYGVDCSQGDSGGEACPRNCMGNGICNRGTGECKCLFDFEGADCSIAAPRCPNNCTGNGECVAKGRGVSGGAGASVCECLPGYGGEDCSVAEREGLDATSCEDNCSGHGVCLDYQCYCSTDYKGATCSVLDRKCPSGCSGSGLCEDGCCNCDAGYKGLHCGVGPAGPLPEEPVCRNNCTGHGICNEDTRRCKCHASWTFDDCSVLMESCPNRCSGHGECLMGRCACSAGWTGEACQTSVQQAKAESEKAGYERGMAHDFFNRTVACPLGCSSHGTCDGSTGECLCWDGWWGLGCEFGQPSTIACPLNCSGHGECVDGQCSCDTGFVGAGCERLDLPCPFLCSGKGVCVEGQCRCFDGFSGDACEAPGYEPRCATNCTGHGECIDGDCHCPTGYRGIDCSVTIGMCPGGCSGNGYCGTDNVCTCVAGFTGPDCAEPRAEDAAAAQCPSACSGKGVCELGWCVCEADQGHYDCGVTVFVCPNGCSGNGVCAEGKCRCEPGFSGEDCSVGSYPFACPQNCSGRGVCVADGKCACREPWTGDACDHVVRCPTDCSGHGVCDPVCAQCLCLHGWGGPDCSALNGCPNDCSGNGQCIDGVCYCDPEFEGRACDAGSNKLKMCTTMQSSAPGYLDAGACGSEEALGDAVARAWESDPPSDAGAAQAWRGLRGAVCADLGWRLCDRVLLSALKVHELAPDALTDFELVRESCHDTCHLHSNFDARVRLDRARNSPTTPRSVAQTITLLVQQCNLFQALQYNATGRDTMRWHRSNVLKYATQLSDLDPGVFLSQHSAGSGGGGGSVDDLVRLLKEPEQGGTLMRRASLSVVPGTADAASRLHHAATLAHALQEGAHAELVAAVSSIRAQGLEAKYFAEVMDAVREGERYALSNLDPPDESAMLPGGMNVETMLKVLGEDNVAERLRDSVYAMAPSSAERGAVVRLLGAANVLSARSQAEVGGTSQLFESKERIKNLAQALFGLDPGCIDDPSALSPDEVTTRLASPDAKSLLRELQAKPAMFKITSMLLHELNALQSLVQELVREARRHAAVLRSFDETLVPDLGRASPAKAVSRGGSSGGGDLTSGRVVALARSPGYIASLDAFLDGDDLDLSVELMNEVRQYTEVMRALSGGLPVGVASFTRLQSLREVVLDLLAQLADKCGLGELEVNPTNTTTAQLAELLGEPHALQALNAIADGSASVDGDDPAQQVVCMRLAQQLLVLAEQLRADLRETISLLRLLGESMHRTAQASYETNRLDVPNPDQYGDDELCSRLYDHLVWTTLRLTDMGYRLVQSNASTIEEDQDELKALTEEAVAVGDVGSWGLQTHMVIDLVVGVLGVGELEALIREAMLLNRRVVQLLEDVSKTRPDLLSDLNGMTQVPPLAQHCNGATEVVSGSAPPPLRVKIMALAVLGLPGSMLDYCPENVARPTDVTGSAVNTDAAAHYTMAGNPQRFGETVTVEVMLDTFRYSVRCCGKDGSRVPMSEYGCHSSMSFQEARALCGLHELRLCTRTELEACTTCGTGCGFDRHRVWTNDTDAAARPVAPPPQPTPPPPNPLCLKVVQLQADTDRLAELSDALLKLAVDIAANVRADAPQLVPSLAGMVLEDSGDQLVDALVQPDAIATLVKGIQQLAHGPVRVNGNSLLELSLLYASTFSTVVDGGPGTVPVLEANPDQLSPAPCSGNGVFLNGVCFCGPFRRGLTCNETISYDQVYQEGWRLGFEATMANFSSRAVEDTVVQDAIGMFDRAAQLLKGTATGMTDLDRACEQAVPTAHLSALEILFAIEDPGWLRDFRKCPSIPFRAKLPALMNQGMLLRREYEDVATVTKHLAIKAATLDCMSVLSLASAPGSSSLACGSVAHKLTETEHVTVLQRAVAEANTAELRASLRDAATPALHQTLQAVLDLVTVVLKHSECPGHCSVRGVCLMQRCNCYQGWTGLMCERHAQLPPGVCPRNCTFHGECANGTCACDSGWTGYDCSTSTLCPRNCTGHGACVDGVCHCFMKWTGADCSLPRETCPDDFHCLRGHCREGECVCDAGWTGDDCSVGDFFKDHNVDGFWGDVAESAVFLEQQQQQRPRREANGGGAGVRLQEADLGSPPV